MGGGRKRSATPVEAMADEGSIANDFGLEDFLDLDEAPGPPGKGKFHGRQGGRATLLRRADRGSMCSGDGYVIAKSRFPLAIRPHLALSRTDRSTTTNALGTDRGPAAIR